jgi:DNA-binding transcriptional LysR family regulator
MADILIGWNMRMRTDTRGRLDGVAVFVETVDAGGFARAAERLSLSRSAVGKAIARLEARLGVRLFHRTTRSQNLTDDGLIYYEHCLRAIEELRAGESLLESGKREVVGRLRVTMPVLFGRHCIVPILLEFGSQHPNLELDLSFSDRPVDMIAEGFDLGIRNGPLGEVAGICARVLPTQPKVLCASPRYFDAHGRPESIEALSGHQALIHWRRGHPYPWLLPQEDGRLIEIILPSRFRFDNLEAVADASVAGMGISWLPRWLVNTHIQTGSLEPLWADRPAASIESHVIWPATDCIPFRMRVAIDALVEKLPELLAKQEPVAGA